MQKTYCIDCGTYIHSVAPGLRRDLARNAEQYPRVIIQERVLLERVKEHDVIGRAQIVQAEMMLVEAQRLAPGDYTLLSIGNMFIDCADPVLITYNREPVCQRIRLNLQQTNNQ